ncbi:MAG: hypothetical protein ACK4WF_05685, partial [Candidatus Brocadiales bacterium]
LAKEPLVMTASLSAYPVVKPEDPKYEEHIKKLRDILKSGAESITTDVELVQWEEKLRSFK